jgi:hypothetical protein
MCMYSGRRLDIPCACKAYDSKAMLRRQREQRAGVMHWERALVLADKGCALQCEKQKASLEGDAPRNRLGLWSRPSRPLSGFDFALQFKT